MDDGDVARPSSAFESPVAISSCVSPMKLAQDVRKVRIDQLLGDSEGVGDLGNVVPFGERRQDFPLGSLELVIRGRPAGRFRPEGRPGGLVASRALL